MVQYLIHQEMQCWDFLLSIPSHPLLLYLPHVLRMCVEQCRHRPGLIYVCVNIESESNG